MIRQTSVFLSTLFFVGCTIADAPPLPSDTAVDKTDHGFTDSSTTDSDVETDAGTIDTGSSQELDTKGGEDDAHSEVVSDGGIDAAEPDTADVAGATDTDSVEDVGLSDAAAADGQASDATTAADTDGNDSSDA